MTARSAEQRVLVLGASGFFGGWICRELNNQGFEVLPATRESGNLLDPEGLSRLVATAGLAAVINAAGVSSPALAREDPARCFELNVTGVHNLLETVRVEAPAARVIALSSAAIYDGKPPFNESSPTGARDPYSASKLAMEILCDQYSRGHGLAVSVLRCFNLTGPGEPATQATSEFVKAALSARSGALEVRVGEPSTSRDFTDVRDAARAVRLILEQEATGTFNLCSGEARSLGWLAGTIGDLTGVELTLRGSGTGRPASGQLRSVGDDSKLRSATGWQPVIPLKTSLGDLVSRLSERG